MAARKRVKEGEQFLFCNGTVAKSIAELRKQLERLSRDEFHYHVNEGKHDFYAWIKDCLDPKLAERIKEVRDQDQLIDALKQSP